MSQWYKKHLHNNIVSWSIVRKFAAITIVVIGVGEYMCDVENDVDKGKGRIISSSSDKGVGAAKSVPLRMESDAFKEWKGLSDGECWLDM